MFLSTHEILCKTSLFFIVILSLIVCIQSPLPVAVFHGIGDACNFPGTTDFVDYLREKLQTDVICIEQGNGFITSWFTKFQKQSEMACESIKSNPIFQGEFSVLGISQGNLIARYIIQKCDIKGKVKNFVSIDGPHMGIAGIPRLNCGWLCEKINNLAGKLMYTEAFQEHLGAAGYYKDKYHLDDYREFSTFLADLNNEKEVKNDDYKRRFSELNRLVLIMNESDTVINPPSTAWFEFYEASSNKVIPLKESEFYKEDYIGLRELDNSGKIRFVKLNGDHIHFSDYDIDTYMIPALG
jgi:palmitoyl-protein thioesterase